MAELHAEMTPRWHKTYLDILDQLLSLVCIGGRLLRGVLA
jgi:hypothetical protein